MDIAVVVNLRARRGSREVAEACRSALPTADVMVSGSLDEALGFARRLQASPPSLLVSAGGDGTAVTLINAMRRPAGTDVAGPAFGLIPLGTGNGWANVTGAPRWRKALDHLGALAERGGPLPLRRFDLVEVEGTIAPFAGTGWDAELIDDFNAQKSGFGLLPPRLRQGVGGYLQGLFTRTIPRHFRHAQVEVEVTNTGDDALTVDAQGRLVPLRGGEHGKVLYRGPTSVCGAATSAEWGFGFRAFPFADLVPRRFELRVYAAKAIEATLHMKQLWRGEHPVPKMHTFHLTRAHATFSRAVPFQIGGDRMGARAEVDFALAPERVDLLDWRAARA